MKLRNHQFSIKPRIFEGSTYSHPWYQYAAKEENISEKWAYDSSLIRPNPPSKEAVERAKFVDKTYEWTRRPSSIRSRN